MVGNILAEKEKYSDKILIIYFKSEKSKFFFYNTNFRFFYGKEVKFIYKLCKWSLALASHLTKCFERVIKNAL